MPAIDLGSFEWPPSGGNGSGVTIYANFAAFPVSAPVGTLAIDASTGTLYEFFGGMWQVLAELGFTPGASYQQLFNGSSGGLINGVNTVFTLTITPSQAASLLLSGDNGPLFQGIDYTIAGNIITMAIAPPFGSTLYAYYNVVSGVIGVTDINGQGGSLTFTGTGGTTVTNVGGAFTVNSASSSPLTVIGSRAGPELIMAAGGIPFTSSTALTKEYIQGNGGAVVVTANPQIAAGSFDGQELTLQSTDATDTVEIQDGNGLAMNGPWIGGLNSVITFTWDLTNWVEKGRQ